MSNQLRKDVNRAVIEKYGAISPQASYMKKLHDVFAKIENENMFSNLKDMPGTCFKFKNDIEAGLYHDYITVKDDDKGVISFVSLQNGNIGRFNINDNKAMNQLIVIIA